MWTYLWSRACKGYFDDVVFQKQPCSKKKLCDWFFLRCLPIYSHLLNNMNRYVCIEIIYPISKMNGNVSIYSIVPSGIFWFDSEFPLITDYEF